MEKSKIIIKPYRITVKRVVMKTIATYVKSDLKGSVMCNGEKSYIAYAVTKSKTFKTAKGADAFMVRNGFKIK